MSDKKKYEDMTDDERADAGLELVSSFVHDRVTEKEFKEMSEQQITNALLTEIIGELFNHLTNHRSIEDIGFYTSLENNHKEMLKAVKETNGVIATFMQEFRGIRLAQQKQKDGN